MAEHEDVPVGEWTDVKPGQVAAPDTYIDAHGVLRDVRDHSCVVWRWGPEHCTVKGIQPDEIVYDPETGAPWCPHCWPIRQKFYERKRIREMFESN